jgi:hypothetical protein
MAIQHFATNAASRNLHSQMQHHTSFNPVQHPYAYTTNIMYQLNVARYPLLATAFNASSSHGQASHGQATLCSNLVFLLQRLYSRFPSPRTASIMKPLQHLQISPLNCIPCLEQTTQKSPNNTYQSKARYHILSPIAYQYLMTLYGTAHGTI